MSLNEEDIIKLNTMKFQINITEEVIFESRMCGEMDHSHSKNCAVALAIRNLFPDARVSMKEIRIGNYPNSYYIPLPEVAQTFIAAFDTTPSYSRHLLKPISFEIDVPERLIDRIGINEVNSILEHSKTLKRVIQYDTIKG